MINREDFIQLSEIHAPHCISLYLAITRTDKDRITLKNMLSNVSTVLKNTYGLDNRDCESILKNIKNDMENPEWWQKKAKGLAIFIYNNQLEYHFSSESFNTRTYIADHLYLVPLAPQVHYHDSIYLMPLSEHSVGLYEVTQDGIQKTYMTEDFPQRVEDVVGYDIEDQHLQFREGQGGGEEGNNHMFHGHGTGDGKEKKKEYLKFFKKVDDELEKSVADSSKPLVIACVDYLFPLYKEATHYPNLYPKPLEGNFEHTHTDNLFRKALPILQTYEEKTIAAKKEQFQESLNVKKSSYNEEEIVSAAMNGRIDTLFIKHGAELWGHYKKSTNSIILEESPSIENASLLNLAAINTIKNNGTVYLVEENAMPEESHVMNALFRYNITED